MDGSLGSIREEPKKRSEPVSFLFTIYSDKRIETSISLFGRGGIVFEGGVRVEILIHVEINAGLVARFPTRISKQPVECN